MKLSGTVNLIYRTLRLYHANRSPRAWGRLLAYPLRAMTGRSAPRFMTIGLTYRCGCSCDFCYLGTPEKDIKEELTTREVKSVIDQISRLGTLEVIFSGGDPLLRQDIVELVRHAHDAGLLTRINTPGNLLDPALAGRLKAAGLTQCAVSIDDADPDAHDRSRGLPGLHRQALAGILNLQTLGIPCQIVTLASRETITAGLERVIALGRELGVISVYICFPVAIGRQEGAREDVLTESEMARVRTLQDATFVHLELPQARTPCRVCGLMILYVSPRGDVTPCPFVPYAMGNVKRQPLAEIWRRHAAKLDLMCRGSCPLNQPRMREALRRHVEAVANSK